MKGEKKSWEFHGFSSNPQKSFEAGKKGNRLAVEASLRASQQPAAAAGGSKSPNEGSIQNKPTQGKGWQSVSAGSEEAGKKKGTSAEE